MVKRNVEIAELQMTLGIEFIPPFICSLQVAGEPCHNGIVPQHAFIVVGHEMVLTFHLYEFYSLAQNLQCIEELDALTDGHVGVYGTMEQQQRCVDLVGIEERALLGEEVGVLPGITVCCGNGVVAISPVALSPVAGDVTDAGV